MIKELEAAITALTDKAKDGRDCDTAMRFSQAALNLSHVLVHARQTGPSPEAGDTPGTTFKERVVEEQLDLLQREEALAGFLTGVAFKQLPSAEQLRLQEQHIRMNQYLDVLTARISADFK